MSYYDDASLMFLAGGGAQKDGTAYSVKPIPEYGSEEITNGDFATDSDWTKGGGATISGGQANIIGGGGYVSITQNSVFTAGKKYRVSVDVVINSGLGLKFQDGANNENIGFATSSGTYVFDFTAGSNTSFVVGRRTGGTAFNSSVDNVSVKEVLVNGDFTFSRGSNLAATRVDAAHLIEKGRENLLLQSNQFDTTWTTTAANITSGQSGYDGTSNAWLLERNGSVNGRVNQSVSTSGVNTFSLYAKSGSFDWLILRFDNLGERYFDLNNGVLGGSRTVAPVYSFIQSVGNGWYRCSVVTNGSSANVRIYPASSNLDTTGSNGTIYIQDAQLEVGLAATEYIESGATTGTAGILEDTPRFDYSNGASCPSLLLEPSRSNLIQSSEYFGAWGITNGSVTANNLVSPEGLINGTKFQITGASVLSQTITSVAGTATTFSVFAKSGNHSIFRLGNVSSTQRAAWFDLSTGTKLNVNGGTSTIENYGNGWYRCTASFTSSVDGIYFIALSASGGSTAAPSSGSNINIYGAMVESNASFASSYIPNHSGGTITRAADVCGGAGDANTFNSTEGVFYAEISALAEDSDSKRITISDGSLTNRITISISDRVVSGFINVSNATQYTFYEANQNVLSTIKIAVKYKTNDFAFWINGSEYDVSTSGNTFSSGTLNELSFDNATGGNNFQGNVKQVLTFNTALSDADLATLTTI